MIESLYIMPTCQNFWVKRFPNFNFKWDLIWSKLPQCTNEARLISLNWKILHNIYPTKTMLYKMGKEVSNRCDVCNVIDHIDHFFYSCKKINRIWKTVNHIISCNLKKAISLSETDVLFGVHTTNISNENNILIHHVIAIAKLCISKFRYGKHPNLIFLFENELSIRHITY